MKRDVDEVVPARGLWRCHHPELASIVIDDSGPFMTRAFIAADATGLKTVAPHSHRTSIKITLLRGLVRHDIIDTTRDGGMGDAVAHTYESKLLGGAGLGQGFETSWDFRDRQVLSHPGDWIVLNYRDVHTVSWTEGSIWVVEEGPLMTDRTRVVLRDGLDEFTTENMYIPMLLTEYLRELDLVWRLRAEIA